MEYVLLIFIVDLTQIMSVVDVGNVYTSEEERVLVVRVVLFLVFVCIVKFIQEIILVIENGSCYFL